MDPAVSSAPAADLPLARLVAEDRQDDAPTVVADPVRWNSSRNFRILVLVLVTLAVGLSLGLASR